VQGLVRLPTQPEPAQVVEQRARCRLTALDRPEPRQDRVAIGSPEARYGPAVPAQPHEAARGPGDQRHPVFRQIGVAGMACDQAQRAGIGVDRTRGHRDAGRQAELFRGGRCQAADGRAEPDRGLPDAAACCEVTETDGGQEVVRPARGTAGAVAPFAVEGGGRALGAAGRLPGKEIREVEGEPDARPAVGQPALQPEQLRDLHLRRHGAALLGDGRMAGRGTFLGLGPGAMVEPGDGVPLGLAVARDVDGFSRRIADNERAGGVKGEARDRFGRGARLRPCRAERCGDRGPDVRAVVLALARGGPTERDRPRRAAEQPAAPVEEAGARAAGPDIHRRDKFSHLRKAPPAPREAIASNR
jgi:hypothetical protein